MRDVRRLAAAAAFLIMSSPALSAVTIDGTVASGEYGAPAAIVATDPAAPVGNFGAPGNTARAGYNLYLTDTNDTLFGAVVQTGGTVAGSFVNLYFDIDPTTGTGGSELGIEVTNKRGFVAGTSTYFDLSPYISWSTSTLSGITTTEFSISNDVFRQFIAGAAATGYFGAGGYTQQPVGLNMSQSLSYSVAGGSSGRLGLFSAAAPEPASWAMMVGGFGLVGFAMRRRQRASIRFA